MPIKKRLIETSVLEPQSSPKLKGFRKRWAQKSQPWSVIEQSASQSHDASSHIGGYADQLYDQMRKKQKVIIMPWENSLYSQVFGPIVPALYRTMPEFSYVPEPQLQPQHEEIMEHPKSHSLSSFKWKLQSKSSLADYESQSKTKRLAALGRWRKILGHCKKESGLGWMFPEGAALEDDMVIKSLEDLFGSKATSTLAKRAGSMLQYINWTVVQGLQPFPVKEHQAYDYVRMLNGTAGATAAMTFRESLNFCKHVIGMRGMDEALASKRMHGACLRQLSQKGQPHQASPYTYEQLMKLEALVLDKPGTYDAFAAGAILITVLGRCRWSDLNNIYHADFEDPQIAELGTFEHKTAGLQGMKGRLLPILIPIFSFGAVQWFKSWKQTATTFGRDWKSKPLGPLLPILIDDDWIGEIPVSSADISKFLQTVLEPSSNQKLSSHSGKATLLSWSAKYGLPLEVREVLGRHSRSANTTATIYSRDLQGHSIECLLQVLHSVKSGRFNPEVCRSQRWSATTVEIKDESDDGNDTDSVASAVELSDSSASDDDEDFVEEEDFNLGSSLLFAHAKSQVLHTKTHLSDSTFKCGTPISNMFVQTSDDAKAYHPQCHRCFKQA